MTPTVAPELPTKPDAAASANSFFTQLLRLAACLIGPCQYPLEKVDRVERHGKRTELHRFWIGLVSTLAMPPLRVLLRDFNSGRLETDTPLHPLCCGMRGQLCYESLLAMQQTGQPHRLERSKTGESFTYVPGSELPSLVNGPTVPVTDLTLAAAVGPIGIPVVRITGAPGARVYHLSAVGHLVMIGGVEQRYSAGRVTKRNPISEDPLRLALEGFDPQHPVCCAYDALHARGKLKNTLSGVRPVLHIQAAAKQALIDPNASERVLSKLEHYLGSPNTL